MSKGKKRNGNGRSQGVWDVAGGTEGASAAPRRADRWGGSVA